MCTIKEQLEAEVRKMNITLHKILAELSDEKYDYNPLADVILDIISKIEEY